MHPPKLNELTVLMYSVNRRYASEGKAEIAHADEISASFS
jgi:hypothetical protein